MGDGSTRTYKNVTPAIFACVKSTSFKEHQTVYAPPDANTGIATTPKYNVVLSFVFDPSASTLTYTITQEPWYVTDNEIWDGICSTINECGGTC